MIDDLAKPSSIAPYPPVPTLGERRRPRKGRIVLWTLAALALALIAMLLLRHHENAARAAAPHPVAGIAVASATATRGDMGIYLDAIGTVTPVYTASITSQVTGQIIAVHYKEGQVMAKGDPLIIVDPRPYLATLLQAQGALERDENVLAQARMDLERYAAAWKRNAIAKQVLDDQEKLVLQAGGTVKTDRGTVQFDQVQVDNCRIKAPIAGRVGLRLVDPGNVVQSSGAVVLAVITQSAPTTVIFTIPEDSLGQVEARLRKGAVLSVEAFDRSAQTRIAAGRLLTLDNQIDTTTGTVRGRALFDNLDAALFPNQFVNTRLLVDTLRGVTLLPASAIQKNGQASFVYVIQDNLAHLRSVKTGVTHGGLTQVEGVQPGDVVADSGFEKLQDKSPVVVVNKPAPAAAGGSPAQ
ncbi:MAG: efflux RND transporter periplasmic adaptor subunit [Holophaga sp.]|nr:efflux RND transporter periplasmic adaptor subunit [Holophaga sp.]